MKKFISNKYVIYVFGIILVILLWWIIAEIIGEKLLIFPDPWSTFAYAFKLLGQKYTYYCIWQTFKRMLIGFIASFLLALIFGSISGSVPYIEELLRPALVFLKAIPTATLVFLFLVIAGISNAPIYIVMLIAFPILYEAVLGGIKSTSKEIIEAAEVDGANKKRITLKMRIPLAIPYILVGQAASFSLAFKIEIMAEVITGSTKEGLGSAILAMQKSGDGSMIPVFAYSLIAIILMLIVALISDFVKKLSKN